MLSRKQSNMLKRLAKTPLVIDPDRYTPVWSLSNGQGYTRSRFGYIVKISDPMPEGYREERLAERDRRIGL